MQKMGVEISFAIYIKSSKAFLKPLKSYQYKKFNFASGE